MRRMYGGDPPQLLLAGGGDEGGPLEALFQLGHPAALPATQPVSPKEEVEHPPKDRGQKDGGDPGDFVGRVAAVVDDIQHHHHAYSDTYSVEIDKVFVKAQQHHQQNSQLKHKGGSGEDQAVKQQPEQLFGNRFFLFHDPSSRFCFPKGGLLRQKLRLLF